MSAPFGSRQDCIDRHRQICSELRAGLVSDPEVSLFLDLLESPPQELRATPLLAAVGWDSGRYDLLFTDGRGRFCAVEVKREPEVTGTGRARRNRGEKGRQKVKKLIRQTINAAAAAARVGDGPAVALGLVRSGNGWREVARIGRWGPDSSIG